MKSGMIKYDNPHILDNSDEFNENDKINDYERFSLPRQPAKPRVSHNLVLIVVAIIAITIAICAVCLTIMMKTPDDSDVPSPSVLPDEPAVITVSALEKIVETSKLSSYEINYTGIAKRNNEKNPEKVDYYVSYSATVKAGIEFNQIDFSLDDENKVVVARLPAVEITSCYVDPSSLDYLFYNNKLNKDGVTKEAFDLCTVDLEEEINKNETLHTLAEQNAKKTIEALISPFIEALGGEYTLEIRTAS